MQRTPMAFSAHIVKNRRKRFFRKFVSLLCCVVVFCTTYALILPAITQEQTAYCGIEEHTHSEACSPTVPEHVLICTLAEDESHSHEEACFGPPQTLPPETVASCQLEEHIHSENCFIEPAIPTDPTVPPETTVPPTIPSEEDGITQLEAILYTGEDCAIPLTDGTRILLTGIFPVGAYVQAYPVTIESAMDVLCAYDITIFEANGTVYEPPDGESVHVQIQSPILDGNQEELQVFHIPESGTPDPVDAAVSQGSVDFEADHFSVYAVTRAADSSITSSISGVNASFEYQEKTYSIDTLETLCGYKINVTAHFDWGVQNPYWGGETMTVTITSEQFRGKSNLEVRRVDDWGGISTMESTHNGNKVTFYTTPGNCVQGFYIIVALPESMSSMTLTEDFVVSKKLFITDEVTIDLNGHTIRPADGYGNEPLFDVQAGGNLTILDSAATAPTVESTTLDPLGAHAATVSDLRSGVALTYYVTKPTITNAGLGATQEIVYAHTVTAGGLIRGGSGPVIRASGGTVNLQSGMLYGGSGQAIAISGNATVNLRGGYICNFRGSSEGGAIYMSGGTLNIQADAVIAANHATTRGGGIFLAGGNVSITGGVISGNTAADSSCSNGPSGSDSGLGTYGGGGITLNGGSLSQSGGYITNNESLATGYWAGGGGIYAAGSNTIRISGGYITSNTANAGGGIKTRDYGGGSATVYITGGFFCSNLSTHAEGGGISIGAWDDATIEGGYINNNYADCRIDWGGGGIFIANEATMQIIGALVTENSAGGFGGGAAGCSTAKMSIASDGGGAIFDNDADGAHMSGDGSTKTDDWTYGWDSPVFMASGYADLYNALTGSVDGSMLGGGSANWQGSCDGVPVGTVSSQDALYCERVMGLTAHPSDGSKAAAQAAAQVYVNGNYAYTHGGGILCNGYLLVGRSSGISIGVQLELSATKVYQDHTGGSLPLTDGQFSFVVEKEQDGNRQVVSQGENNAAGTILFDSPLFLTTAGTHIYYIREVPGTTPGVTYDTTQYRLTIKTSVTYRQSSYGGFTESLCTIDEIKLERHNGSTWVVTIPAYRPADPGSAPIALGSFLNRGTKAPTETTLTAEKRWSHETFAVPVTVTLLQNGNAYPENGTVVLSAENNWSHTWEALPMADSSGIPFQYTVAETPLSGFNTAYTTEFLDTGQRIIITNTLRTYRLDLTKQSSHKVPVLLEGAVFRLLDPGGNPLHFTLQPDGTYAWTDTGTTRLSTDAKGKLILTGLPGGSYTLEEVRAPFGYQEASPQTIVLGGAGMEENQTLTLTVIDHLLEYELPETGGFGTCPYLAAGIFLLLSALWILWHLHRRRKEDPFS